jgi:GNAT-family acetyltransferase (TIGR03103 family)
MASDETDTPRRGPRRRGQGGYRLRRMHEQGLSHASDAPLAEGEQVERNAIVDCGWGRLLFAQTFRDPAVLVEEMRTEAPERRDIAFYVREPHVLLAAAPQELFLDPSHTFRLDLSTYRASRRRASGFFVRRLSSRLDAEAVNRIYALTHMVPVPPDFFWSNRDSRALTYLVAEDEASGEIIGTITGVDHARAYRDPHRGASFWCLAADPQAPHPGIGEALVRRLAEHYAARGSSYLDLSVLHDNEQAIALYERLGFRRVPFFTIKRKNPINERLFSGPDPADDLNPYARILVDEARRRGIAVEVTDAQGGFFRLSHGGRSIRCRESLTELTSAVAMSICDDKAVTRRVVERAGVRVPEQTEASAPEALTEFLDRHGQVVVKPARGEQGRGVAVGLETLEEVRAAMERARTLSDRVIVEACAEGEDLRLIVIGYRLVAAAIRRPAQITGDGRSDTRTLIESRSRRRAAQTGGESRIPMDEETMRCLARAGYAPDDVPGEGEVIQVRRTANLHTGGTIHDVTEEVHSTLVEAAIRAARAIDIPVVGLDFIVPSPRLPDYVFIEANERPGLANHEPQPTAERFIDLLFPLSMPAAARDAHFEARGN